MKKSKKLISVLLSLVMLFGVLTSAGVVSADAAVKILGTLSINVGQSRNLNFTDPSGNKVSVKWTSENPKIASVTSSGKVTGKKAGTVVIKTTWNSTEYGVNIKVIGSSGSSSTSTKKTNTTTKKTTKKTTKTTKKTNGKKISISKKSVVLKKGKTVKLKLKNAKASKVKWSVKNRKIASVKKGKVKAKKAGSTVVYAKYKKKSYKCRLNCYSMKKLGSKKVSEKKNSANIKGVNITFSPFMFTKTAKTTVKKVSGLPKLGSAKMKTYDFSLKNAKVTESDVALIEIPYKVKKGNIPVAGYFNEKKSKWEGVPCDYDGKKITMAVSHFSPYGVGEISSVYKNSVIGKNTTIASVLECWVPKKPSLTGERAIQIMGGAVNSSNPTTSCLEMGFDAINQLFDYTVNWGANFTSAFGFTDKFTIATGNLSSELGALGFALSYVSAVRYALKGEHYQAASTALQGAMGFATGVGFAWIGSAAASAAAFSLAVVSYALNKGYSDMLDANEKKWYDVFKAYYRKGGSGYLSPRAWRDKLKPIIEDTDLSISEKNALIEQEVDDYTNQLWNNESEIAYVFNDTQTKALKGGLNEKLKSKLSSQLKGELYNGTIKLVFEWYSKKAQRDADQALEDANKRIAEELNETVFIMFKDKTKSIVEDSDLEGWRVRFKTIPKRLTDKNRLDMKIGKSGEVTTYYTVYAAVAYGIKPTVEICAPNGKVIDTINMKYTSKEKMNVFNLMTDKVKEYINSKKPTLNKTKLKLIKGNSYTLKLKNAKKKKVSWSTSNYDIASVNGGKVYAKRVGKVVITAKYKGKSYKCDVTVKNLKYVWKLIDSKDVSFDDSGSNINVTMSGSKGSFSYKYTYTTEDKEGNKIKEFHAGTSKLSGIKNSYEPGKKYKLTLELDSDHSANLHWSLHANYQIKFWSNYEKNDYGLPYAKYLDDAYRSEFENIAVPDVDADSSYYRCPSLKKEYEFSFNDYNDPKAFEGEKIMISVEYCGSIETRQYSTFEYQYVPA